MSDVAESAIVKMLKDPAQKEKGFVKLMDLYKEPIYWYIRRLVESHLDAEDILQETFIKVYRHIDSFRGDSKIFTWLYKIATNECSRQFRKNKKWRLINSSDTTNVIAESFETDMEESHVILLKFQQAIVRLPEKQKIVFNLRYYDELNYEEISQILGTSVNASKTNYHLACEKVKKYLSDHA